MMRARTALAVAGLMSWMPLAAGAATPGGPGPTAFKMPAADPVPSSPEKGPFLFSYFLGNGDGLHLAAGSDPERLVEVHGTIREATCTSCGWRGDMVAVMDRVRAGEPDPPCEVCGGILKSGTVFFGEHLDPVDIERAFDAASDTEVLICVGTSLQVYPVAQMVPLALRGGAQVVIVNAEPTPYDDAAVTVHAPIGIALPRIVG